MRVTGRAPDGGPDGDPGVQKEATADTQGGGQNIGFIENGDYVSYTPMNLLNINSMTFRVASGGSGGTIQVRLDAPDGPLVAETANITPTGGWQTYKNVELEIPPTEGTHELFFVFRGGGGGLMNLNWIEFNGRGVSTNARPRVDATATPTQGEAPLEVGFEDLSTGALTSFTFSPNAAMLRGKFELVFEKEKDDKDGQVGKVGYEINFNRYFYVYKPPRAPHVIAEEIREMEKRFVELMKGVVA